MNLRAAANLKWQAIQQEQHEAECERAREEAEKLGALLRNVLEVETTVLPAIGLPPVAYVDGIEFTTKPADTYTRVLAVVVRCDHCGQIAATPVIHGLRDLAIAMHDEEWRTYHQCGTPDYSVPVIVSVEA